MPVSVDIDVVWALAGALLLVLALAIPALVRGARVNPVSSSGPVIASTVCFCRFGAFRISRVAVSVHRGGLVLGLPLFGARAIRTNELRTFDRVGGGLVITHEAPRVTSPIVLWLGEGSPVEHALRHIDDAYGFEERPTNG